ncbi:MAG: hypothetical protein K9K37_05240, partial [Desulfocapsa sp.]|nr:hypothetical protein [Desulfocapsa sp.]
VYCGPGMDGDCWVTLTLTQPTGVRDCVTAARGARKSVGMGVGGPRRGEGIIAGVREPPVLNPPHHLS